MDRDPANFRTSQGQGLTIVRESNLQRIAAYWLEKRGHRTMPSRADIDPTGIPWALSRLFLIDYDRATGEFRYRLAGSEIEAVFEKFLDRPGMRGLTLRDVMPANGAAMVANRWSPLAERGDIVYMSGLIYLAAQSAALGARLLLPLCDDGSGLPTGLVGYTEVRWLGDRDTNRLPETDVVSIPLAELEQSGAAMGDIGRLVA